MASSTPLLLFAILLMVVPGVHRAVGSNCYESIISFGDSIADTGNLVLLTGGTAGASQLPYGETYFNRSTGRFSDGRLIIDFIAEAVGLPLVPPYAGGAKSGNGFKNGVNFAVAGATALDSEFFKKKGIFVSNRYSLDVQMGWFKKLLPSLCATDSECKDKLGKSLFLVGEIGGNDFNNAVMQQQTVQELHTIVPSVVSTISSTITELIGMGARTLVVPGNFPIGCSSGLLTTFKNSSKDDYDPHTGCLNWLNEFAEYQNGQLQKELDSIRAKNPSATIIYADYYNATMSIFRSPASFGFEADEALKTCCGAGSGPYDFDVSVQCWDKRAKVCRDPAKYVCWDGVHLTEAAYRTIAGNLLSGPHALPIVNRTCPQAASKSAYDRPQNSGGEMMIIQTWRAVAILYFSYAVLCLAL